MSIKTLCQEVLSRTNALDRPVIWPTSNHILKVILIPIICPNPRHRHHTTTTTTLIPTYHHFADNPRPTVIVHPNRNNTVAYPRLVPAREAKPRHTASSSLDYYRYPPLRRSRPGLGPDTDRPDLAPRVRLVFLFILTTFHQTRVSPVVSASTLAF